MKIHWEKYKTSVKIEYISYMYILYVGVDDGSAGKKYHEKCNENVLHFGQ